MLTKGKLVEMAFGELALAGYEFDLTADELQDAGGVMETVIAGWLADDVGIAYNFAADPSAVDLGADSGIALVNARTVSCGTAIAIASQFGKAVALETGKAFREGYSRLLRAAAFPREQQLRAQLPAGAGNKRWRLTTNPFLPTPDTSPLQVADNGGLNLGT